MAMEDRHLSDEELILAADGELDSRRDALVRAHLPACWNCRARLAELEGAIADFVRLHSATLDSQVPPPEGARAMLKAQLAALRLSSNASRGWFQPSRWAALAGLAVAASLLLYVALPERAAPVPSRQLTPGAVRQVMKSDVCSSAARDAFLVPAALQRRVFEEYGIRDARPEAYEVDYLITPELGGAADIRNLWPEPYSSTMWNARVKDALEQRLHQMVCDGQLDLATAQHDIATDWIAAYKKYFHSPRPRQN
jgi:hypothetical protein